MIPESNPPQDDSFALLLAAYDDQLQEGRTVVDAPPTPAGMETRLKDAQDFLHVLEARWPRRKPSASADTAPLPKNVGRFSIRRILGQGGAGIVYLAHDPVLGREVAVKVPQLEVILTPERRRRFLREAQAAALLNHPNIIPIHEVSEAGELCFIVYGYCPGPSLAQWLGENPGPVPPVDAARLVESLAESIEHAHQRGILHRDLKPANVLLQMADCRLPIEEGQQPSNELPRVQSAIGNLQSAIPKITDFGLAKIVLDGEDMTQTGLLLGTPAYMAPEQTHGVKEVGPACDVWALGVMLYELLTRTRPFTGDTPLAVMNAIQRQEPRAPRQFNRNVPRDLETICLKCLEKSPADRYPSAFALANDLECFVHHRPTRVRPLSIWKLGWKWTRRHARLTLLGAAAFIALILAAIDGVWILRERQAHQEAIVAAEWELQEQANEVQRQIDQRKALEQEYRYAREIRAAAKAWREHDLPGMTQILNGHQPAAPSEFAPADLRDFVWGYLWRQGRTWAHLQGHRGAVAGLVFSKDGRRCLSASTDGTLRHWSPDSRQLLTTFPLTNNPDTGFAFSQNGSYLVSRRGAESSPNELTFLDAETGRVLGEITVSTGGVDRVAVSPNGRFVAACGTTLRPVNESFVVLWEPSTGKSREVWHGRVDQATCVCFSPNRNSLAIAIGSGMPSPNKSSFVQVLDLDSNALGPRLYQPGNPSNYVVGLAFSPDGRSLASGGRDRQVIVWEHASGKRLHTLAGLNNPVVCLAFSPDGKSIVGGSQPLSDGAPAAGAACLWNLANPTAKPKVLESVDGVLSLAYAPDGETIAIADLNHNIQLWNVNDIREYDEWPAHPSSEAWAVAFSPDGQILATAGDDHRVRLWNARSHQEKTRLDGHESLVAAIAFAPDGSFLVTGGFDGTARIWDAGSGKELRILRGNSGPIRSVAIRGDSSLVATASADHSVRLWQPRTGVLQTTLQRHKDKVRSVVFATDGETLYSGGNDNLLCAWDVAKQSSRHAFKEVNEINALAHAPKQDMVAVATKYGEIHWRRGADGESLAALKGHTKGVLALAFSPDGKTLASAGLDLSLRLWHVATGEELLSFTELPAQVNGLAFSPDGNTLAAALHDGTVRTWHAFTTAKEPRTWE